MVQQVLTDDRSARTVEVYCGNVRGIVGNKEVTIDRRQDAKQHGAGNTQLVGQRQHGHHHSTLGVDEHRDEEEHQGDRPRIGADDVGQHQLHLVEVIGEVSVGQPGNTVDSHNGHHTRLPYRTCHSLLGLCPAEDNHEGSSGNHHDLDDNVHLQRLTVPRGQQRREDSKHDNDQQSGKEYEHSILRLPGNILVERGSRVAVDVVIILGILQLGLEQRVFVEVESAMVAGSGGSHQSANTCRYGNHQHLRNSDIEAVLVGDGDKGHHSSGNGRTGDTNLRGDRGHTAWTLRTDVFLQGNVADDRHQRVDHVTSTDEHRQEESA